MFIPWGPHRSGVPATDRRSPSGRPPHIGTGDGAPAVPGGVPRTLERGAPARAPGHGDRGGRRTPADCRKHVHGRRCGPSFRGRRRPGGGRARAHACTRPNNKLEYGLQWKRRVNLPGRVRRFSD